MARISKQVRFILAMFAAVGMLLVGTVAARADHSGVYVKSNSGEYVPMRYAPTGEVNVKVWMRNGTSFRMICWTDNKWYYGNYWSNRWFYGQEYSQGSYGYVHSSQVINQIWVRRC